MTTRRSRKAATEATIVEAAEDEVQSTDLEQAEPEADVPETDQVEAPQRKPLPGERRCPAHHEFFADEPEMRPISEFRIDKHGRVAPTYCRRCTNKMHAARSREHAAQKYTTATWAGDLADLLCRALNEGFLLEAMADEVNALLSKDPRPQRQESEA